MGGGTTTGSFGTYVNRLKLLGLPLGIIKETRETSNDLVVDVYGVFSNGLSEEITLVRGVPQERARNVALGMIINFGRAYDTMVVTRMIPTQLRSPYLEGAD